MDEKRCIPYEKIFKRDESKESDGVSQTIKGLSSIAIRHFGRANVASREQALTE